MRDHFISYKKAAILLFFLVLFVSGCSGRNENRADESPAEKLESASESVITLETVPPEPEPDEAEAAVTEENWEHYFDGINGAAVIYDPAESSYHIYNQEMALTQRSPCSTFKIISSLIALENGMIVPGDSVREWSGEIFWNEDWNRDIGFEDAFRTSCVWYYRKVIDEIGKNAMQEELNRLHYGNCDISDWEGKLNTNNHNRALTGFWIESSLKISPKEQAEIMERIFGDGSVYSQETQDSLKQVMLLTEVSSTEAMIYGKTGMGKASGVTVDAWFTGFADMDDKRVYFCIYLGETEGKDVSSTKAKEIAVEMIADLERTR